MPIHHDLRPLYPLDWRALANRIKFERAGGRCEWCGRPHGVRVLVVGEGGWLDPETGERYDDRGRSLGRCRVSDWPAGRFVTTVLSCAHLDQNPANNDPANLASLCPRCHWRHDRQQHIRSARYNRRKRWAVGDLFD
ncbi:MAG TPA: hypothetical protein P5284_03315 [Candidatus Contendobacter sp.]|nr:hypothetical protein [Candidatus Contendobacter sp.]HRZ07860.1 hypothetical protein [Candidatus Competibacteraceae bacterium]HRZ52182.1 hypothetical protein [Candidatus Contendobacter sp.]